MSKQGGYFGARQDGKPPKPRYTPEQAARLRELVAEMRKVAAPVGSLHSFWDVMWDMEAFLEGRPTIIRQSADEWIKYAEQCLRQ